MLRASSFNDRRKLWSITWSVMPKAMLMHFLSQVITIWPPHFWMWAWSLPEPLDFHAKPTQIGVNFSTFVEGETRTVKDHFFQVPTIQCVGVRDGFSSLLLVSCFPRLSRIEAWPKWKIYIQASPFTDVSKQRRSLSLVPRGLDISLSFRDTWGLLWIRLLDLFYNGMTMQVLLWGIEVAAESRCEDVGLLRHLLNCIYHGKHSICWLSLVFFSALKIVLSSH